MISQGAKGQPRHWSPTRLRCRPAVPGDEDLCLWLQRHGVSEGSGGWAGCCGASNSGVEWWCILPQTLSSAEELWLYHACHLGGWRVASSVQTTRGGIQARGRGGD